MVDNVLWSSTAAGGTDVKPCPNGASGKSKRKMRCMCFMHAWYREAAIANTRLKKKWFHIYKIIVWD